MPESRILIAQTGKKGLIKIEGQGTFENAGALKKGSLELLKNGVTEFVLDLGTCELLDSTFLGIILGLGLRVKGQGSSRLHILKANNFLQELFGDLGLDRLVIFEEPEDDRAENN